MDLNGLFCKMPRSSSVEPPARFPYTNFIVCPQCPLTVLKGVEGVMRKVAVFSLLLIAGMVGAQFLPSLASDAYTEVSHGLRLATMVALAFIMIHVGYEFELDKANLRHYGWDYVVAMTAAAFPWVFVVLYFMFVLLPAGAWHSWGAWTEALLAGRFAAPTSAGVLFAMLAAAGLSATWLFAKARILAIFDDLDTVVLMIPLQMLIVGLAWQPWGVMAGHVLALTVLANLGKMVPAFCYRREAHWRERLALAVGMWPRGEVGAGVLIVSLGYGLGGPMILAAMLSLALNLILTGVFILMVKWLVAGESTQARSDLLPGTKALDMKGFDR